MKNPVSLFHLESSACLSAPVEINNLRENTVSKRRFQQLIQHLAVAALVALLSSTAARAASVWAGGSANWSSNLNPGWNGTGVPGIGTAAELGSAAKTVTLDVAGTTGSLNMGGSTNALTTLTLTSGLTFNNSGAGSTLSNTDSSTGTSNRLSIAGGNVVLADNLTVSNTSGSTNTSGAITLSSTAPITGTGNLTFYNVSNSASSGAITLSGANTFTGSVLVQKGFVAFSYSTGTSFGNSSNAVTVGQSGQGAASFINTSSNNTVSNSITIAAGSGGALTLGSSSGAASNTTFSGTLLLNGSVELTSSKGAAADVRYTNIISGTGGVTTKGTGETQFGNGSTSITNTYSGNTTLTETSSLVLSDNAKMTFYIGATGVNNKITGSGQTLLLDGDFVFNLSGAASSGTWNIVDISNLAETFSSTFTVAGWTDNLDNTWSSGDYTFSELTGNLTAVPEPAVWGLLAFSLTTVLVFRRRRIS